MRMGLVKANGDVRAEKWFSECTQTRMNEANRAKIGFPQVAQHEAHHVLVAFEKAHRL